MDKCDRRWIKRWHGAGYLPTPHNGIYDLSTYQSITSAETAETVTRIKICGITNADDARAAAAYGADLLGFIGVKSSPRYVAAPPIDASDFATRLGVRTVVVVRTPGDHAHWDVDHVQFYEEGWLGMNGRPDPAMYVRAFRIKDAASLAELRDYKYADRVGAYLLDTHHDNKLGGGGETFDWSLAVEAKRLTDKPIILAGGLTPDNVGAAIARVRPYAVDVSSGVEDEPCRKDHAKLRAFVCAVREADRLLEGKAR